MRIHVYPGEEEKTNSHLPFAISRLSLVELRGGRDDE
jgi:hypothetical protein